MKIQNIHKFLDKSQFETKELTPEELESIYYGDLADSQLNCIWY